MVSSLHNPEEKMAVDLGEPIAIVGIDLKFPGDAATPQRFWDMLMRGDSALGDVPGDRYNAEAFFHPDHERAGTMNLRKAHFLTDNIFAFDAPFFSISPTEAASMDPQQRGILESVYKAFENAGIPIASISGTDTGVYLGSSCQEFRGLALKDPEKDMKHVSTGLNPGLLANRVSWFYGLHGPSFALDTACSSSLIACHLACNSLKTRESSMVVVAGCNLMHIPDYAFSMTSLGFLSKDGVCHSFDHRANGYGRGEGFGVLVLKRLSDAIKDKNTIRAVIRGSSSNQDGKTPGLTQPSTKAQIACTRTAYEQAGIDPSETRYFEAHGTGTQVGDVLEASAIAQAVGKFRSEHDPLYVGALKSNIGHLEGAAGIAGVLKAILVLEKGIIPPNIWLEKENPKIPAQDWNLKFPTSPVVWPTEGLRRASVNAFGFGGANAHVVLDDARYYLESHGLDGIHCTVAKPCLPDAHQPAAPFTVNGDGSTGNTLNGINGHAVTNGHAHSDGYVRTSGHVNTNDHVSTNGHGGANGHDGQKGESESNETKGTNGRNSSQSNIDNLETVLHSLSGTSNDASSMSHNDWLHDYQGKLNSIEQQNEQRMLGVDQELANVAPEVEKVSEPFSGHSRVFVFSAYDEAGVARLAKAYHSHLVDKISAIEHEDQYLSDLAYTLGQRRTCFPWRVSVQANTIATLIEGLGNHFKPIRASPKSHLAFIFTGQGAQWYAMGRDLLSFTPFRESLEAATDYLHELGCPWSLLDEFLQDESHSSINEPEFSQPICTALQIALVELLATWGVHPTAVVGHSSGEIAAAFATGAISRSSAWRLAYQRGVLSSELIHSKDHVSLGMISIALSSVEAQAYIDSLDSPHRDHLSIACVNSPKNVTISGALDAIDLLRPLLDDNGIFARKLKIEMAYHSAFMQPIAAKYRRLIGTLKSGQALNGGENVRFYSSLTGKNIDLCDLRSCEYWVKNLVSPVRFSEAVAAMMADSKPRAKKLGSKGSTKPISELLEIGPHGALRGPIREILQSVSDLKTIAYEAVLKRNEPASQILLGAIGWLFCRGYEVDIAAIGGATGQAIPQLLIDLPGYEFNHSKTYWDESRLSKGHRFRKFPRHELLGAPSPDWDRSNAVWRNYMRTSENPWIKDHVVTGSTIYPAAGMLVMAIEASRQLASPDKKLKAFRLKEMSFHMALRVPLDADGVETHFHMRPYTDSTSLSSSAWYEFELRSYEGNTWVEHCRGLISTEYEVPATPVDDGLEDRLWLQHCTDIVNNAELAQNFTKVSMSQLYEILQTIDLYFGPLCQVVSNTSIDDAFHLLATVTAPDIASRMPHGYVQPHLIHPTVLDGCIHSIFAALHQGGRVVREPMVPTSIKELWIAADPSANHRVQRLYADAEFIGLRESKADIVSLDPVTRQPLVVITGVGLTAVGKRESVEDSTARHLCFNIDWKPDPSFFTQEIVTKAFAPPEAMTSVDPSPMMVEKETLAILYLIRYMNTEPDVAKVPKTRSHLLKFFEWIQLQLERYDLGELPHCRPNCRELALDETYFTNLENKLEHGPPEAVLLVAMGKALPQVLCGEADPLEVMFQQGRADNFYSAATGVDILNFKLCGYIDAVSHKNPGMKILEVGAGTGGTTRSILKTLTRLGDANPGCPRFDSYDFTDISPSFFEKAKETFLYAGDRVRFKALDIENDPAAQGFDLGTYDMVIAANSLHATTSIDKTLQNVRRLLKPGGTLALYESTSFHLTSHCIFGPLPGWWLSVEPHRKWGPNMTLQKWSEHMKKNSFSGIDVVFHDSDKDDCRVCSLMITSAVGDALKARTIPGVVIIADQSSTTQTSLADELVSALSLPNVTHCQIVDLETFRTLSLEQKICIFLADLEDPFLLSISQENYNALQRMTTSASAVLWLTQGGGSSPTRPVAELVTGFARALRTENAVLKFITITMEECKDRTTTVGTVMNVFNGIFVRPEPQVVDNTFSDIDGIIHIPRIIEADEVNKAISTRTVHQRPKQGEFGGEVGRALKLVMGSPGLLDTLHFEDDLLVEQPLKDGEIELKLKAGGLNFLDVMTALGQITRADIGAEGAGTVRRTGPNSRFSPGDRVCGLVTGGLNTYARAVDDTVVEIPEKLSFVQAATLPVVFITAYAALYDIADIQKGETVLIHAAAGGVGQACIQLAQRRGAEIYATCGSMEKVELLQKTFGIPRDHIFSSRDLTFASGVKRMTKTRGGVDVIINSLSGAALRASWDCIAPFGRFVEIGKVDICSSARLNMDKFLQNVRFQCLDILSMGVQNPPKIRRILGEVMKFVNDGSITDLAPTQVFPFSQVQDAFRYMQGGTHSGKIVLEPHREDLVMILPSSKPTYNFDPNASYVISGGLGGLGRSMARWMADRGARNLILLSRSGPTRDSSKELIRELEAMGVRLATPACDVSDAILLKNVIEECLKTMPPIKGCIQGSMVIKDGLFANMSLEDYNAAIRPKVQASWNLHEIMPKNLDFFILLSSASGIRGGGGQSNYCTGNTFQDALARYRVTQGLKGIVLDLGLMLSVGYVAEIVGDVAGLRDEGYASLREDEFHALLDSLCDPKLPVPSPLHSQISLGFALPETFSSKGLDVPWWINDPLFRHLFQIRSTGDTATSSKDSVNFKVLLGQAETQEEAEVIVVQAITQKLSKALSIEAAAISAEQPLHVYGVDSLVAVELRTWFLKELGADVAVFDIMGESTIKALGGLVAGRSSLARFAAVEE